jgi:ribosomal protein S18 acetylase RimI-like enzyme
MKIELTKNELELDECAQIMCSTEPFITLKFTLEKCKAALRGEFKEVYVVRIENEIAGFVAVQTYGLMRGYIQTIALKPEFRNKGIGTALLKFSEERILKEFPNVFMCVSSFNYEAQKLYYRIGFEKIGTLTNHIIQGVDEYILRKQGCPTSEFKL